MIKRSDAEILSNDPVLYDLRQAGNTGVFITFTSNSFAENSTLPQILSEDIPHNALLYSNETKLFIPGCELHIDNNYVCMYVCALCI